MYRVFMRFNLKHSSVHLWKIGCQTKKNTKKLLANNSSGRLLPSLQSVTHIQTERPDEGIKPGEKIAYYL